MGRFVEPESYFETEPTDKVTPKVEFPCYALRVLDGDNLGWVKDDKPYLTLDSAKRALEELATKCKKPKSCYIVHDSDEWHREFTRLVSWNLDKTPNYMEEVYVKHGYWWHCLKGWLK